MEKFNKNIVLIAPLDWGLGHTTRCIPIIRTLKSKNYDVIVAVNSKQRKVLEQENLDIKFEEIEGYNISYSSNKLLFILKIILQIPKILLAIKRENNWLKNYASQNKVDIIISDNRYGFFHKNIKSIFITHQLTIKANSRIVENILRKINYRFINKFNECWVPDSNDENSIAGDLSTPKKLPNISTKYIGCLNRFTENIVTENIVYDSCVLLSGPEPQRTILEEIIIKQIKSNKNILLIRGLPSNAETLSNPNFQVINHLSQNELLKKINQSKMLICRSGYTTVMEMVALQKPFIAIATPMQTEQEYLAKYLAEKNICLSYNQDNFNVEKALADAEKFNFKYLNIDNKLLEQTINKLCET